MGVLFERESGGGWTNWPTEKRLSWMGNRKVYDRIRTKEKANVLAEIELFFFLLYAQTFELQPEKDPPIYKEFPDKCERIRWLYASVS